MAHAISHNTVGVVTPKTFVFEQPIELACGRSLNGFTLAYETYGQLNTDKSNAVLICHALSGDHHAAGFHSAEETKPGWWDAYIGPGKPIDTNKFFVVSVNNIGGCAGSTGPSSVNPDTGQVWGAHFPSIRVRDWVQTQALLMDALGLTEWAAVIGGSLGGMQAMRWCVDYPDRLRHCIVIAAAMKLTAQNIAFNEIARQAITSDPDFRGGHYIAAKNSPKKGLAIARMIGHVTYLSGTVMGEKFGRDLRSGTFQVGSEAGIEFQVESYLRYQSETFSDHFDANTYLLMTKALDFFDLGRDFDDEPARAFANTDAKFLVIAFTSDWRFSSERSREITDALLRANKSVSYAEIDAPHGHDAFLIPIPRYQKVLAAYMQSIGFQGG